MTRKRKPLKSPDFYIACRPSGRAIVSSRASRPKMTENLARMWLWDYHSLDYSPAEFYGRGYTVRKGADG